MTKDKDVRDVIREETSRGSRRKTIDTTTKAQQERIHAAMLRAIKERNEADFIAALHDLGYVEDSDVFEKTMKNWRDRFGGGKK
jgi:hypothetical protein